MIFETTIFDYTLHIGRRKFSPRYRARWEVIDDLHIDLYLDSRWIDSKEELFRVLHHEFFEIAAMACGALAISDNGHNTFDMSHAVFTTIDTEAVLATWRLLPKLWKAIRENTLDNINGHAKEKENGQKAQAQPRPETGH